ncbi:MAG: hypothetical protein WCR67_05465 [Bacilli bacterium]
MNQEKLEKAQVIFQKTADELGIQLISVNIINDPDLGGKVLQVFIDKDYSISMEDIQKYTDIVNPLLDELDEEDTDGYVLDISSGGSQREIPFSDLAKLTDHYLDITLKTGEKITAKNLSQENGECQLVYFIKGRKKKLSLKPEDMVSIRMGYKA